MSSGISNFNTQTGLSYNNPEFPRIGFYSCNTCNSGGGECCVPLNGIIMYNDSSAVFPNYAFGGAVWNLCDGTLGTPDLRNQFVYGNDIDANLGTTGGAATQTTTIQLTAADLPQHSHSIPALTINAIATTEADQNGTAGDIANTDHLHSGFGASNSQPAAFALFKRFFYYAASASCPIPDPPLAPADLMEGSIFAYANCSGNIEPNPLNMTVPEAQDNWSQWTGGMYVAGGNSALQLHTHTVPQHQTNTGTTGNAGSPVPITITSASFSILPPYTKLYYICRTA
jgi:hypothetical protein